MADFKTMLDVWHIDEARGVPPEHRSAALAMADRNQRAFQDGIDKLKAAKHETQEAQDE